MECDTKWQLVAIDEAVQPARCSDPGRTVPHHFFVPMLPLRHVDQALSGQIVLVVVLGKRLMHGNGLPDARFTLDQRRQA
ncbi:hypothetical protein D3C87_1643390 [compost metagenome]